MNNKTQEGSFTDRYLIKRLSEYMAKSKLKLSIAFVLIVISISIQVYIPLLVSIALDDALTKNNKTLLIYIVAIYFVLLMLSNAIQYCIQYLFAIIGENAIFYLRNDVFRKLQRQSQDYFDTTPTGDSVSRLTTDIENMQHILSGSVLYSFLSIFQVIGIIIIMLNKSIILTIIALIIIPLAFISMWANKKYVRAVLFDSFKQTGDISSIITENILGAKVNAAFTRVDENIREFEVKNKKLANTVFRANRNAAFVGPLSRIFSFLIIASVLFFGTILRNNGHSSITVGVLFLFISYTQNLTNPVVQITQISNQIQNSFASFSRIISLYDAPSSIIEKESARDLKNIEGRIELRKVTFAYNKGMDNVLENFSLNIKPGEKIAIVGHTGAGKSTITKLITRIYEIDSGEILIDDQNIQNLTLSSLRQNIGVVLQEPILYSDSIRFNLNIGAQVSDAKLFEILDLIGADFVKALPKGLDTKLGERASRISSGQKQLLSFARALVLDPKYIILDEATSSIDAEAELTIQKALTEMLNKRTAIMIAHRLSTVKIADRIIVLSNGKIIEEGSFEELLKYKGEFFELYNLQFLNQIK